MTADRRGGGWPTGRLLFVLAVLFADPLMRLSAQDTSAIDRGVRIGIIYRPGVRPGVVVLPGREAALDSVRTIVLRDLDYSDRFEVITLPGGDSIRSDAPAPPPPPSGPGAAIGARARPGRGHLVDAQRLEPAVFPDHYSLHVISSVNHDGGKAVLLAPVLSPCAYCVPATQPYVWKS